MLEAGIMRKDLTEKKFRYIAAVLGLVVGDALGVPAEFKSRAECSG